MVGSGSPHTGQEFHAPEFIERDAAPVIRRSHRLQTAFAFSAVLVAKHAKLPVLVPSKSVRTKQTVAIVVDSRDWPSALYSRAHNPINILSRSRAARSRNAHYTFRLLATNNT